jgi:hypothetical protein
MKHSCGQVGTKKHEKKYTPLNPLFLEGKPYNSPLLRGVGGVL